MSRNMGQRGVASYLTPGATGTTLALTGNMSAGRFLAADDTAAAPGFSYQTDGGVGLAKLAAAIAGLCAGGTYRAYVDANGLVANNNFAVNGLATIAAQLCTTPSVMTLAAAGTAIVATALVELDNTSGGSLTLTSAPTIANGTVDGQLCILRNRSAQNVVIQDQGTLASSNLRLTATTLTLGQRDVVPLQWSTNLGDWIQIAPLTNVL